MKNVCVDEKDGIRSLVLDAGWLIDEYPFVHETATCSAKLMLIISENLIDAVNHSIVGRNRHPLWPIFTFVILSFARIEQARLIGCHNRALLRQYLCNEKLR